MEPTTLLTVAFAVTLGFFVRAVAGFAAALIALPIMFLVLPPEQAVGLLAVYFFAFSLVMMYRHKNLLRKDMLLKMGIAILAGMIVGVAFLSWLPGAILLKLLGGFILCYLGYKYVLRDRTDLFERLGLVTGFVGGVFSGIYASGGSLYITYLHNRFNDADLLRANAIGVLGVADLLRLPLFINQGFISGNVLWLALMVLPCFCLAVYAGHKLHNRIPQRAFDKAVAGLLAISAIMLIVG